MRFSPNCRSTLRLSAILVSATITLWAGSATNSAMEWSLLDATGCIAPSSATSDTEEDTAHESEFTDTEMTALKLWADFATGALTEKEFEERGINKFPGGKFKESMKSASAKMKRLGRDVSGPERAVSAEEFIRRMPKKDSLPSSFSSYRIIGISDGRAQLECKVHVTSRTSYVVVFTTDANQLSRKTLSLFPVGFL